MRIAPLSAGFDRSQFDCGEADLNEYLKNFAGQHSRKNQSRTFIAVEESSNRIWGYYTLSSASIAVEVVPENLPRHPIPVALLGRLAIDLEKRGQGLGSILLADAIQRVVTISEQIGVYAIVVDALHEQARNFYLHFGFRELLDNPLHLFLSLKAAKKHLQAIHSQSPQPRSG
ncbi:MAG: GNAT family N-acetyltransferase [Acidobacteriota bacterium]